MYEVHGCQSSKVSGHKPFSCNPTSRLTICLGDWIGLEKGNDRTTKFRKGHKGTFFWGGGGENDREKQTAVLINYSFHFSS